MADLERCLQEADAAGARFKLVFSDGVFSMDGTIARLDEMRALCDRYDALLGIDECHASGFMGRTGRGTHEHRGCSARSTSSPARLGKALGGASGGFTAAEARGRRAAAPALAALPVLEHADAGDRRRVDRGARPARSQHRAARQARGQHALVPRARSLTPASTSSPASIRSCRSWCTTRQRRRRWRRGCSSSASTWSASSSRWCRKGQARIRVQMSAVHERAAARTRGGGVRAGGARAGLASLEDHLIIGANGQIGTELAVALVERHGAAAVVTSDVAPEGRVPRLAHEMLDVTDAGGARRGGRAPWHHADRTPRGCAVGERREASAVGLGPEHERACSTCSNLRARTSSSRCSGRARSPPSALARRPTRRRRRR